MTEQQQKEQLKELVSDDVFLKKLIEAARLTGWNNDFIEVRGFVHDCLKAADRPTPDFEPHVIEYEQQGEEGA